MEEGERNDDNGEVGSALHKKGQKQTKKHAGMAPKKAGRKLGQKDTKPRKKYTRRAAHAAPPVAAVGHHGLHRHAFVHGRCDGAFIHCARV